MGGSKGRPEATGYGLIYCVREACKRLGLDISKTKAAIQGFGNVSQFAAELYIKKYGGTVVCVSSWNQQEQKAYTFKKAEGIDFDYLLSITSKFGDIDIEKAKEAGYEILPGDDWIIQDVDILLPCALENQINEETVKKIKPNVKIVAEGANGPTTPEADKILSDKGIFNIPDFLANAGGVTCSYFEQVQCNMNYFWEKEEVLEKLDRKMTSAFNSVADLAEQKNLYMRDAAYMISIQRVAEACKLRGWI
jgi:glutamate dehydrogenase (NAD(P)+)